MVASGRSRPVSNGMKYTIQERKKLPKSQFRFEIEIPVEEIELRQKDVLAREGKELELPGFRKGHVPDEIIRSRMGELALFEEAAFEALHDALQETFLSERLETVGWPEVAPIKLVPQNPACFRVTVSLFPTLTLPDYKKIAAKQNKKPEDIHGAEEKEIDAVIEEITKQHELATGGKKFVLSEDTVKELGEFQTVSAFREKVKEDALAHKKAREREKRLEELLKNLIKNSEGEIPDILVENELSRMETELKSEIERMGGSFKHYLKEINKDSDTLKKEWRLDAETRARLELLLLQISRAENIKPTEDAVEREVNRILEQYKDVSKKIARSFVETILTKQKVVEFLENLK